MWFNQQKNTLRVIENFDCNEFLLYRTLIGILNSIINIIIWF
jgi:hypothetical protein